MVNVPKAFQNQIPNVGSEIHAGPFWTDQGHWLEHTRPPEQEKLMKHWINIEDTKGSIAILPARWGPWHSTLVVGGHESERPAARGPGVAVAAFRRARRGVIMFCGAPGPGEEVRVLSALLLRSCFFLMPATAHPSRCHWRPVPHGMGMASLSVDACDLLRQPRPVDVIIHPA